MVKPDKNVALIDERMNCTMERKMKKQLLIIDDKIAIAKIISVYLSEEYDITYFT